MEMEEKELWMSKLKEKLADYSEPVPASGWERLEKELVPPAERRIYPYRKWAMAVAAAVLLAVVSSLSLYFLNTPAADEMRHVQAPELASAPDALPEVQQPDAQGAPIVPALRAVPRKDRLAEADKNLTDRQANESIPAVEEDKTPGDDEAEPQSTRPQEAEQRSNKPRRPSGRDKFHVPAGKRPSQKGTWSMGLSVGNAGGVSTEVGAGQPAYMSRVSMLSVSNGLMEIPNDQTLVFEDGIPYLRQAKRVIDIKHHQPVSFGLSVRKVLLKGFSLESGLVYTLLSSDAKVEGEEHEIEQKLHYVGIPLRVNWNFLDKRLVTLYVSGGGMVEKCVYGKLGSEKETVKPLQFSVSGAVGAQVNATKRLGIYVEPGVAYYFDDGSDIQTIRKENPFQINIQAGIRLTY